MTKISMDDFHLESMSGESRSGLGRGGMTTDVAVARLTSRSGASTVIASGNERSVIS
jgi:glutamate 5-kinase